MKAPLADGGSFALPPSARRKFALGVQIYCGEILMVAEPAYNTVAGRAYALP